MGHPKRKVVFQPSIFRCYVSFRECMYVLSKCPGVFSHFRWLCVVLAYDLIFRRSWRITRFGQYVSLGWNHQLDTPPKFNIDPEKWWLEDYFPIGKVTLQGRTVKLREGIWFAYLLLLQGEDYYPFILSIWLEDNSDRFFCNEQWKNPGCLVFIGDDKLPSFVGIVANHYKDPYYPTRISWNVGWPRPFVWSGWVSDLWHSAKRRFLLQKNGVG